MKSIPAPAAIQVGRWRPEPIRCEAIIKAPPATSAASNASAPVSAYFECEPVVLVLAAVIASSARPAVVRPMPSHCLRSSLKPKKRSASTPRITKPLASTAWTREIGANFSAVTWRAQATIATPNPIDHHLRLNSSIVVRTGRRTSTSGASTAPR